MAETPHGRLVSVDTLLDEQSQCWRRGQRVPLEHFAERLGADAEALLTLLYQEIVLRQQHGETPRPEEYVARFPQLAAQIHAQFEVDQAIQADTPPSAVSSPDDATAGPVFPAVPGYEVLAEVGRGGMGVVYKAHHLKLDRLVALKMIRDPHATAEDLARFRTEAEAVARLQHPHIVQIHELGEHQGLPFLALEYVGGGTLAKKIDGTPRPAGEAAAVVQTLARAVHAAHQSDIVHRDLKPVNVLLTVDGQPKIADFGLAKKLEAPGQTLSGVIVGTVSYMAPEQAAGKSNTVGAAADVYALGAVLYEMLTGRPPFRGETLLDTLQQLLTEEVVPPSRLNAEVPRDLETVCLKCLRKNASRRYATALALAEDLRCFQAGEPVQARRVGVLERSAKWARRHQGLSAGLAAAVCALVSGTVVATWFALAAAAEAESARSSAAAEKLAKEQAQEAATAAVGAARQEEQAKRAALTAVAAEKLALAQARKRLMQIENANELLGSIFDNLDPKEIAKNERPLQAILVEKLDKAVEQLQGESIGDPLIVAALQDKFGASLLALGEPDKALVLLEKARATREAELGPDHPTTLGSMSRLAEGYRAAGRLDKALPLFEETLKLQKAKLGLDHPDTLRSMSNLATGCQAAGQLNQALTLFAETLQLQKVKLGLDHSDTLLSMGNLASCYVRLGQPDKALPLFAETLRLHKTKFGPDHPDTLTTMNNLAVGYRVAGQLDKALPLLEQTLQLRKSKLGPDHPSTLTSMNNLALGYRAANQLDKALPLFEETLQHRKSKLGADHPDTLQSMSNLAEGYRAAGQVHKALPLFEEALQFRKSKLGPDHPDTLQTMNNLAVGYRIAGLLDKALPLLEETLERMKAKLGPDHLDTLTSMHNLAFGYQVAGQLDKALPLFEEALQLKKAKLGPDHPATLSTLANLAVVYFAVKQPDKALPLVAEWVAAQRQRLGANDPRFASSLVGISPELLKARQFAEAEKLLREALAIGAKSEPDAWATFHTQSLLGAALLGRQKYQDAESLLLAGYQGMKQRAAKIPATAKARLVDAAQRLVELYEAWDRPEAAALWRKTVAAEQAKLPTKNP